jgi:molybdate transport system substrate-binding protein
MISRLIVLLGLIAALPAAASDITILASQGVASMLEALAPDYERASGDHLALRFGLSGGLKKEIAAGAPCDLVILTREHIDQLAADGAISAGAHPSIASSGVGIAMRKGAVRPPLANQQDFIALLTKANSIAFSASGGSGVYFQQLLEKLGLKQELAAKLRPQAGGLSGELVARGEVEYAVQMVSELQDVPGTELVGPLPPDLQLITGFAAGISAKAANAAGAARLIDYLTAPARAPLIRAKGLVPG